MTLLRKRVFLTAMLAGSLVSGAALAHHGWSWAEDQQITLQGTLQSVSMAPPHPTLQVRAADGQLWRVDLGNPNQTQRSGFTGETARAGDAITVLGNRSREAGARHMKAVRVTLAGRDYDMYPDRIGSR
jgi:hypothetical protein